MSTSAQDDTAALDPNTPTGRRQKLIRDAMATPEGAAGMAKHLENPKVDPTIKHQIVEELFAAKQAVANLEPIIKLLLGKDRLARQVQWIFRRAVDEKAIAEAVITRLRGISDGTSKRAGEQDVRQATAIALSLIPRVDAIALLIDLWASSRDPKTKAECRAQAGRVIPAVESPGAARAYLLDNRFLTYYDLRDKVDRYLRAEIDRLRHYKNLVLSDADAKECFEFLKGSDLEAKRTVATRLVQLAKQRDYTPLEVDAFADGLLGALELERNEPAVVAGVVGALKELLNGGKSPLADPKRSERLVAAVRPVAARPEHWAAAGMACVELLSALGGESAANLAPFAGSPAATVRSAAIDKLGALARQRNELRHYIGGEFARRLEKESDPAVRQRLLFNLKDAPIEAARGSIEKLLAGKKLARAETEYCVEILGKLKSSESRVALLKLARTASDERMRLYAVSAGLLPRRVSPEETALILRALENMALSDKEPISLRVGLVKVIGEGAGREAYDALGRIARVEALKKQAGLSRLAMAERLAKNARGMDDLRVAIRALGSFAGGDHARLDKLAKTILKTAAERKLRAEAARLYYARLHKKQHEKNPGAKLEDLLALYKEAADNAKSDGLANALHEELCSEYTKLLLDGHKSAQPNTARVAEAIACLNKLAKLAGKDDGKAAGYLLRAADLAVDLKDRPVAEDLLNQAEKKGADATQLANIRSKVAALPKKPS